MNEIYWLEDDLTFLFNLFCQILGFKWNLNPEITMSDRRWMYLDLFLC
jgi:hypothetical protein